MNVRRVWLDRIHAAWNSRSICWLQGVRRAGKTVLAQSIADADYYDCELPSVRRDLRDAERFLDAHEGRHVVLDEIHRLDDPSELLKIAADHHPNIRVLATGPVSLAARAKFRDTLAGRKHEVWLTTIRMYRSCFVSRNAVRSRDSSRCCWWTAVEYSRRRDLPARAR